MFSEAISSISCCWRSSSLPIASAISGSVSARLAAEELRKQRLGCGGAHRRTPWAGINGMHRKRRSTTLPAAVPRDGEEENGGYTTGSRSVGGCPGERHLRSVLPDGAPSSRQSHEPRSMPQITAKGKPRRRCPDRLDVGWMGRNAGAIHRGGVACWDGSDGHWRRVCSRSPRLPSRRRRCRRRSLSDRPVVRRAAEAGGRTCVEPHGSRLHRCGPDSSITPIPDRRHLAGRSTRR